LRTEYGSIQTSLLSSLTTSETSHKMI
jgi:hypothetical protein